MGRKSAIKGLPAEVRSLVERLMREDDKSLDEMIAAIREQFPEQAPSRSSLGRYRQSFDEMAGRMREIDSAARLIVSELGENVDDRAGALLVQMVTSLAVNCAMKANDPDAKISVKEVSDLARAARAVMQARTLSLKERQAIEAAARERALNEAAEAVATMTKTAGLSDETAAAIRAQILGVGT